MTADTKCEVKRPEDLAELYALIRPMIGKECWGARLAYGGELTLDIGGRVRRHPRYEQGEWLLKARATPWWIEPPEDAPGEENDLTALLRSIEGVTISSLHLHFPDLALRVEFSNGYTLTLTPEEEDDEDDEDGEPLSSWELFAPDHRMLAVGPGPVWTYGRSDV